MYCAKCGSKNNDDAQFCKKCGTSLNIHSNIKQGNETFQKNNSSNTNLKIISITIIIIVLILAGTFVLLSNNNNQDDSSAENIATTTSSNTETQSTNNLRIISGSFSTDNYLPAKTYATIYVGQEHAGESVKIRIFYSNSGTQLNPGNIVDKTVDNSGYVTVRTANPLNNYPDYAEITLYYGNGNVADTHNVKMNPSGGTQTF